MGGAEDMINTRSELPEIIFPVASKRWAKAQMFKLKKKLFKPDAHSQYYSEGWKLLL